MNGNRVSDSFTLENPSSSCRSVSCTLDYRYGPRDELVDELPSWRDDTHWDYDEALNVESETVGSSTRTFTYEGNRLDTEQGPEGNKRYLYDVEGNVDCVTEGDFQGSKCPPASGQAPAVDPALQADYTWDFRGRLTKFRAFAGGTPGDSADYAYDALERLVEQSEHQGQTIRHSCFSYLGLTGAVSAERRVGAQSACSAPPSLTKSYAFGADLERTSMSVAGAGADDGDYFYARNVHGDPSLLLDDEGLRKGSYAYSAYGSPFGDLTREEALETTTPFNPYRFNDRRLDALSGSADMGARRYSSALGGGRFLQSDSYEGAGDDLGLALGPLTMNRYAFAAGNPLSFVETDGHAFAAESTSRPARVRVNFNSLDRLNPKNAGPAAESTWKEDKGANQPDALMRGLGFLGKTLDPRPIASDAYWSFTHPVDRVMGRGRAQNQTMAIPFGPTRMVGGVRLHGAVGESEVAASGAVRAGEAGSYGGLRARSLVGDELDLHHMPQAAAGLTSRREGGALAMPHGEHALTRTYGVRGAMALKEDAALTFRQTLAKDIWDIRSIAGNRYNQGLLDLIDYYRRNFPALMARSGR